MEFSKYHGIGNDFVLVEQTPPTDVIRDICDRRTGVGADGVLVVSSESDGDCRMTVYNADGSRPEMCGNGLRCAAHYWARENRIEKEKFEIQTDTGTKKCVIHECKKARWVISVEVASRPRSVETKRVEFGGETFDLRYLNLGNPHAVVFVEEIETSLVNNLGLFLNSEHEEFEHGINLEFAKVLEDSPNQVEIEVYERGVGLTDACGTGACAVATAGWWDNYFESDPVEVYLPGGKLRVESKERVLHLRGPSVHVFDGKIPDQRG